MHVIADYDALHRATLVGATMKKYNQIMTKETKTLLFNVTMFGGAIAVQHWFGDVLAV